MSNCFRAANMRRLFLDFDTNHDGTIDRQELSKVFDQLGQHHTEAEIKRMMELVDKDKSGSLSYEEFIAEVFGQQA